jgi:hypothetical protein
MQNSVPLPAVRGLEWIDEYRGRLRIGDQTAEVRLEAKGQARVRLGLQRGPDPADALRKNVALPGNLRYAGAWDDPSLVGDAWVEESVLGLGMREISRGIRHAWAVHRPRPPAQAERGPYKELLANLVEENGLDVVDLNGGWELHTRVRGHRGSVRVSPEKGGLRLYRTVLNSVASGLPARAVDDLALRLNQRARMVRLARRDEGLAVEARLSDDLVSPARLAETARAIAAVSAEVRPVLLTLGRHERLARYYADTFRLRNGDSQR